MTNAYYSYLSIKGAVAFLHLQTFKKQTKMLTLLYQLRFCCIHENSETLVVLPKLPNLHMLYILLKFLC